jgi:cysteine-rich repeat protein
MLALSVWSFAMHSVPASAECGDSNLEDASEECDDGNAANGDGCSSTCWLECEEIGAAATDHTCLHASFGPYDTAPAQEYPPGFIFGTVDSPHTHYTVSLPGTHGTTRSAVSYWPTSKGTFAIYTKGKIPLEVTTEALAAVPLRIEHEVSTCSDPSSLTWVRVFQLSDDAPYYVVFGPTTDTHAVLVIERLDGSKSGYYLDNDGDGFGDEETGLWSWCAVPGRIEESGDCDDDAVTIHPGAEELCNGVDDDCDLEMVEVCEESDAGSDDAGLEPESDAGLEDAGVEPPTDAGTDDDAGGQPATSDAGMAADAGGTGQEPAEPGALDAGDDGDIGSDAQDAGDGERPRRRDSSGCQASRGGANDLPWLLLMMLVFQRARARVRARLG